jgi:hypothetical protein
MAMRTIGVLKIDVGTFSAAFKRYFVGAKVQFAGQLFDASLLLPGGVEFLLSKLGSWITHLHDVKRATARTTIPVA